MPEIKNKNIIILLKSFALGGAERQALSLAGTLQNEKNCRVYIYSYLPSSSRETFDKECKKLGLKHLFVVSNPLSASGNFKYLKRRVKIALFGLKLRKHKPNIIIPYLNPPSIIASLCSKIAGAKTTFWHHRGVDYYRGDLLEQKAISKTKVFIANSENGKKELEERLKVHSEKVFTIPNFSIIKQGISNPFQGNITIGMVSHFRKEKYQELLIDSFIELYKTIKNIQLVLVGDVIENDAEVSSYANVVEKIETNGLEDVVTIHHKTSAEEILPKLTIGVLLSENEGMPNTVMEYMAYKLPVVATNHPGCKQLLGAANNFLVSNSKEEVIEKLNDLIVSEALRENEGIKNFNRLNDAFSMSNYIHKLENILYN
ncbi:MAG: glycosyltransferase family 4 protein [Flavobacteriaceae bacterium]|nr:glycosyltransferase family 4 protein [Flavobacteriaceae bacterium]